MYNHDDGIMIFTVTNWDRKTVNKCDMNPHHVLCSVYKLNLVIFYCADYSLGSTLLHHWVSFPRIHKEKNKKIVLMEAKKQKYFRNIYKGKYCIHISY